MVLLGSSLLGEGQLLSEVSVWALFKIKDPKIGVLERSKGLLIPRENRVQFFIGLSEDKNHCSGS